MNGKEFVKTLRTRLAASGGKSELTNSKLAQSLGIATQTIINWESKGELRAADVSNMIVKALKVARARAESKAIKPIVEFFRIEVAESLQGARWELFSTLGNNGAAHPYRKGLREKLEHAHGVYVFYDSRGRALYSGKAKKLTLWKEMNDALNRKRTVQHVFRVSHPESQVAFRDSSEKFRQIISQSVQLYDMARYVSAYEVTERLIDTFESILIRSFANDLLNVKMEKFGGGSQTVKKKIKQNKKVSVNFK